MALPRVDRIVKGTLAGVTGAYTPAKGPRDLSPSQKRTLESEERLMAEAAGAAKPAEPKHTPPPIRVDVPEFDPARPFAEVRGEGNVGFVQGRAYFDRARKFVKLAPEHAWYNPEPVKKNDTQAEARREVLRLPVLRDVPRAPRAIIDAEHENAAAVRAEEHAE